MDPSLRTQVDTQAEEQEHLSDAQSGTCIISDVSSTIFPAYSSRESVGPDHPPTCTGQTRTGVALDQPCFNYIRGLILVIEFGQNENLIYEHIALAELPDSVPGKFHCMECFLYFNSKTELLVHLLKSGRDLCEDTSKHIVCPVCFVEFIGTERVEHLETHVARVSPTLDVFVSLLPLKHHVMLSS